MQTSYRWFIALFSLLFTLPVYSQLEPDMVQIPSGHFLMGDDDGGLDSNEKPVHKVNIDGFYLANTEITFTQWDACVTDGGCTNYADDNNWGRGDKPVINVSWEDTQDYIRWLNKKTGKQYRLPTEAEWEYACRSAKQGEKYSDGDGNNKKVVWFTKKPSQEENKTLTPVPVTTTTVNELGLYHMTDNAWEWVQDWYDKKAYRKHAENNPVRLTPGKESYRVYRGGSWFIHTSRRRCADRDHLSPGRRLNRIGFRLAASTLEVTKKVLPPPTPKISYKHISLAADAYFDTDKSLLKPAGKASLTKFVLDLKQYQSIKSIVATGHTDSRGSESYNQALSKRRALAVKRFLVQQGIDSAIITTEGQGEMNPIASNTTTQGRAKNRRVDVVIGVVEQFVE